MKRRYWFCIFVLYGLGVIQFFYGSPSPRNQSQKSEDIVEEYVETNDSRNCFIPTLNPFDPTLTKYHKQIRLPNCSVLAMDNHHFVTFKNGILSLNPNFSCKDAEYEVFDMGEDDYHNKVIFNQTFNSPTRIESEFVKVSCLVNSKLLTNSFARVVRNETAVAKAKEILVIKKPTEQPLNIICLGFDSTSRSSYERNLPLTQKWFKENLQKVERGADLNTNNKNLLFAMDGYMVAGDGTTVQLQGMLTGRSAEYLHEARNGFNGTTVDDWPFIFKNMSNHGYITTFAEDQPGTGAFNFRLRGFKHKPTDHYMRPFWKEQGYKACIGRPNEPAVLLDYALQIRRTYRDVPTFTYLYSKVSHDNTNYIQIVDQDLVDFLQKFKDEGFLENSMVLLWGDHGTRFGSVRLTKPGKLEERMPMNFVVLPTSFAQSHMPLASNLLVNQKRLITPYDYHATFEHLLSIPYTNKFFPTMPYQDSIFHGRPLNRTCADANVNDHHCICYKRSDVPLGSPVVMKGVEAILKFLNSIVSEDSHASQVCEPLVLRSIRDAEMLKAYPDPLYQVQFSVYPGNSLFEGTFKLIGNQTIEVLPHFSRITSYVGGRCGVSPHVMRVCYCKRTKNKPK